QWLADRELEFAQVYLTEPCVHAAITANKRGEISFTMALKVACIELAKLKNKLREHVNISELNQPPVIAIPAVVARMPKDGEVEAAIDTGCERERQKF